MALDRHPIDSHRPQVARVLGIVLVPRLIFPQPTPSSATLDEFGRPSVGCCARHVDQTRGDSAMLLVLARNPDENLIALSRCHLTSPTRCPELPRAPPSGSRTATSRTPGVR